MSCRSFALMDPGEMSCTKFMAIGIHGGAQDTSLTYANRRLVLAWEISNGAHFGRNFSSWSRCQRSVTPVVVNKTCRRRSAVCASCPSMNNWQYERADSYVVADVVNQVRGLLGSTASSCKGHRQSPERALARIVGDIEPVRNPGSRADNGAGRANRAGCA